MFKRWRMWEAIGRKSMEVRRYWHEGKPRKGERQTFIPDQTADDSSNKRLLLAKGWIAGRWLFRGSPGLNPRWRVLDVARSGQSCENGRSSIRSFIGYDFPISSSTTFRSTTLPSLPLPLLCQWHNLDLFYSFRTPFSLWSTSSHNFSYNLVIVRSYRVFGFYLSYR